MTPSLTNSTWVKRRSTDIWRSMSHRCLSSRLHRHNRGRLHHPRHRRSLCARCSSQRHRRDRSLSPRQRRCRHGITSGLSIPTTRSSLFLVNSRSQDNLEFCSRNDQPAITLTVWDKTFVKLPALANVKRIWVVIDRADDNAAFLRSLLNDEWLRVRAVRPPGIPIASGESISRETTCCPAR
jgi:hypothetical protein